MTERQADGQASYQFVFSAFYLSAYPPLQDHPFLESHTMQVHKPFILFPSIHLTEEPLFCPEATRQQIWELIYDNPYRVCRQRTFPKGSRFSTQFLAHPAVRCHAQFYHVSRVGIGNPDDDIIVQCLRIGTGEVHLAENTA